MNPACPLGSAVAVMLTSVPSENAPTTAARKRRSPRGRAWPERRGSIGMLPRSVPSAANRVDRRPTKSRAMSVSPRMRTTPSNCLYSPGPSPSLPSSRIGSPLVVNHLSEGPSSSATTISPFVSLTTPRILPNSPSDPRPRPPNMTNGSSSMVHGDDSTHTVPELLMTGAEPDSASRANSRFATMSFSGNLPVRSSVQALTQRQMPVPTPSVATTRRCVETALLPS
jgi:hypothetical protein